MVCHLKINQITLGLIRDVIFSFQKLLTHSFFCFHYFLSINVIFWFFINVNNLGISEITNCQNEISWNAVKLLKFFWLQHKRSLAKAGSPDAGTSGYCKRAKQLRSFYSAGWMEEKCWEESWRKSPPDVSGPKILQEEVKKELETIAKRSSGGVLHLLTSILAPLLRVNSFTKN